ncbi:MAG: hypothetical protein ACQEP1_06675 [Nanobdellota archaeon]
MEKRDLWGLMERYKRDPESVSGDNISFPEHFTALSASVSDKTLHIKAEGEVNTKQVSSSIWDALSNIPNNRFNIIYQLSWDLNGFKEDNPKGFEGFDSLIMNLESKKGIISSEVNSFGFNIGLREDYKGHTEELIKLFNPDNIKVRLTNEDYERINSGMGSPKGLHPPFSGEEYATIIGPERIIRSYGEYLGKSLFKGGPGNIRLSKKHRLSGLFTNGSSRFMRELTDYVSTIGHSESELRCFPTGKNKMSYDNAKISGLYVKERFNGNIFTYQKYLLSDIASMESKLRLDKAACMPGVAQSVYDAAGIKIK